MKIVLPFTVTLPRKKGPGRVWILGLNHYRNTHFHVLNAAKVEWKKVVLEQVIKLPTGSFPPKDVPLRFVYTVYPATKRSFDLANVLSVVQKFTDDALIELGVIPDDSFKIIPQIDYRFGGQDKDNPRVELEILEVL